MTNEQTLKEAIINILHRFFPLPYAEDPKKVQAKIDELNEDSALKAKTKLAIELVEILAKDQLEMRAEIKKIKQKLE